MALIAHEELLISNPDSAQEPASPISVSPAVYRILGAMGRLNGVVVQDGPTISPDSFKVRDDPNRNYSDPIPKCPEATLPIVISSVEELESPELDIALKGVDYEVHQNSIIDAQIAPKGLAKFIKQLKAVPSKFTSVLETGQKLADSITPGTRLAETGYRATKNFLTSKEHKNDRRRVALALGGLALIGGASFAAYKGIDFGGGHVNSGHLKAGEVTSHNSGTNTFDAVHQAMIAIKVTNLNQAARAVHKAREIKESLSFSGDTIWAHVHTHLQAKFPHLNSSRLNALTDIYSKKELIINHLKNGAQKHMHVGQSFKILKFLR